MKRAKEVGTTLYLPKDFRRRAEALIPTLNEVPDLVALGSMTRHRVLRLAVAKGLEVLEATYARDERREG